MNTEIFVRAVIPILENILMYIAFLIGSFSSAKFIKEEDHYYNNRKKYILLSVIIFSLISGLNLSKYLQMLMFCTINGILVCQIMGESGKRIVGFSLYVLLIDNIICFALSNIKGLEYIIIRLIVLIILFLLDKCIYKFNINKDSVKEYNKVEIIKVVINYILIICVIALGIYSMHKKSIVYVSNIFYISLLIIYINFYIFQNIKLNNKLVYIESLESDKKRLTKENDKIRIFKHDFNNIIQAMNGYVQTEDIPSLKTFIKKMIKDINESEEPCIGNKFLLNNKAITNLLNSKNEKAKRENIDINFEIMFELKLLKKYEYELIRILGVFLDNAIEAEREEEDKKIEVLFLKDRDSIRLIIENTCTKEIDINKIYTKEFSTKKGNTGLGLWEVKNLVESNPNFSLDTTLNDNFFRHTLTIV